MQSIKSKVSRALIDGRYTFINNQGLTNARYGNFAQKTLILLCNTKGRSQTLGRIFKDVSEFYEPFLHSYNENIGKFDVIIHVKMIEAAIHYLLLSPNYLLLTGYLLSNGYLILTGSRVHDEYLNNKTTESDTATKIHLTEHQLHNITYGTVPGKDKWNGIILAFLKIYNRPRDSAAKLCRTFVIKQSEDYDDPIDNFHNYMDSYVTQGLERAVMKDFLNHSIYTDHNLYKFKGVLSFINDDQSKYDVNQIAMLFILKFSLLKFLDHASLFKHNRVSVHDYSGYLNPAKPQNEKVVVNHDRFIQQLIRANDPRLVYLNNQPVVHSLDKLDLKIGNQCQKSNTLTNEGIDKEGDQELKMSKDVNASSMTQVQLPKIHIHRDRSIGAYEALQEGTRITVLSNYRITSNIYHLLWHSSISDSLDGEYCYNEFKLNDHFYITYVQNVRSLNDITEELQPNVIIPNILYMMYPQGFTVHNYCVNVTHMIGFGTKSIIQQTHGHAEYTIHVAGNNFGPVSYKNAGTECSEYDINIPNRDVIVFDQGLSNSKAIADHLKNIKKNKLFYRYVINGKI